MTIKELPRALSRSGETITQIKRSGAARRTMSDRDFTYTAPIECDDGNTTECVYILRGNAGRYEEDFCGTAYQGSLVFVEELDVDVEGIVIPGWVFNGTDDTGVYGYHFSASEVPELGAFTVLIGDEHRPGQQFNVGGGMLTSRTSP